MALHTYILYVVSWTVSVTTNFWSVVLSVPSMGKGTSTFTPFISFPSTNTYKSCGEDRFLISRFDDGECGVPTIDNFKQTLFSISNKCRIEIHLLSISLPCSRAVCAWGIPCPLRSSWDLRLKLIQIFK